MRLRFLVVGALVVTGVVVLSLTRGQEPRTPPAPPDAPPVIPAAYREPAPSTPPAPSAATTLTPERDLSKLTDTQKQALITAQRGARWLFNMNTRTGRFHSPFLPAHNQPPTTNNF